MNACSTKKRPGGLRAIVGVAFLAMVSACDAPVFSGCGTEETTVRDTSPEPTTRSYVSADAPYELDVPTEWERVDASSLNRHADFAATFGDRLFLMIIPQKLPQVGDMDPPTADALKKASLSRMSENVKEFHVERDGPLELGPADGLSVFAEGVSEGTHVQYIATYLTHRGWGYQVVAWGPAKDEEKLVDAIDTFFEGWQFTEDSVPSGRSEAEESGDSSGRSDAGTDDDSSGPSVDATADSDPKPSNSNP